MKLLQVAFLACALVASARAGYEDQETYAPQPYQFGYETQDEYGNRQSRHEQDAGDGVKTGMYGFRDASGLYRQVQYVADHRGFRAWVKTNEPGTQDSAPASARIESQQPHGAAVASAAAAAPHHYRLVAPRQQVHRLATVAATPTFVAAAPAVVAAAPAIVAAAPTFSAPAKPTYVAAAAPTFVASPLRKVPVHHSLYPISAVSARHGPIEHAFSQQVPVVRQPSFRRLAARPSAVGPLVAPGAAAAQGPSLTAVDFGGSSGITNGHAGGGAEGRLAGGSGGSGSGGGRAGGRASGSSDAGGPSRGVKKVRRRKPAEFFKKSIINKPRANKSRNVRVRVAQTAKDGGARSDEVPVYKD